MQPRPVYHLDLDDAKIQGARLALLPGDPFRSVRIAEWIAALYGGRAAAAPLAHKREFCSYSGRHPRRPGPHRVDGYRRTLALDRDR